MATILRGDILVRGASRRVAICGGSIIQRRTFSLQELDEKKGSRERVVILGSGWGGFGLARQLDLKHYQPLIITPRTYFVFTPLLASTTVGTLEFRQAMEHSRSRPGTEVIRAWAEQIDFSEKTIIVEGAVQSKDKVGSIIGDGKKFEVKWDKVVVAVGAFSQTFGVEGVKDHAFFLKDVADARAIRRRILECFEEAALPTASEARKKQLLHFAVVGGGPTGIEFSAELHDLLSDDLTKLYPSLAKYHRITVYDVAPRILSMFDASLAKYAEKVFSRQKISIKTSHHVHKVTSEAVHTQEDGEVPVGCVVWSTGLAPNPFLTKALKGKLYLDERSSKIVVDDHLRARSMGEKSSASCPLDDVFAIGDCAIIGGQELPATAQVANQQAIWLGKTLNKAAVRKAARGKPGPVKLQDEKMFRFRSLGIMAYLGGWRAITQSGSAELKGRMAWVLWRTAYMTKSVSWRNRILIPTLWFTNWVMGRDINRF
ncbi:pyridine nucleotide-disulfide oxidoreductase-domain-containing protein [Tuber borchii]|uniref:Pyridine nucleotide-disulfide oxidoreductase-domain-containing protein n=1 Tax=Tuber borchii TaxID=42251 RepID=A0A2T7A707_TUBBO|nr:pyridine nucleotide-disulfide oxidoreductase-domain-containing protein [Tuber borchii]